MKTLLARWLRRWADRLDPPKYVWSITVAALPKNAVIDELEIIPFREV